MQDPVEGQGCPFQSSEHEPEFLDHKGWKGNRIAQAIQAKAAGTEPTADMNPVLQTQRRLRIPGNLGEPYADRSAGQYYDSIAEMNEVLAGALERLYREHDIIVMEGAGGAAEINLMKGIL